MHLFWGNSGFDQEELEILNLKYRIKVYQNV